MQAPLEAAGTVSLWSSVLLQTPPRTCAQGRGWGTSVAKSACLASIPGHGLRPTETQATPAAQGAQGCTSGIAGLHPALGTGQRILRAWPPAPRKGTAVLMGSLKFLFVCSNKFFLNRFIDHDHLECVLKLTSRALRKCPFPVC